MTKNIIIFVLLIVLFVSFVSHNNDKNKNAILQSELQNIAVMNHSFITAELDDGWNKYLLFLNAEYQPVTQWGKQFYYNKCNELQSKEEKH